MRGLALLLSLTAAAAVQVQGQGAGSLGPISDAFRVLIREDSIVGAAAVLVREGRIVSHVEMGMADRARGLRVDPGTIFHWASITKTLTAVAIMQLRDRGKLSLDDPITRWVPELRQVHDTFGSMDDITLRMLLSHSSGFQNPTWPYRRYLDWEPFEPTRWEQLVSMMPYQELLFRPGSRFGYSNPAFIYLARVIEQVTGDPYQSYIYKNIWGPLGLTRSYFGATPYFLAVERSNNYTVLKDSSGGISVRENGADFDPGITIPNGGWNAPLGDVAKWAAFLTGAASNDSSRQAFGFVLSRSTLAEMWRPVVPVQDSGAAPDSVGLGFFLNAGKSGPLVFHTGEQAGFLSLLCINPRTRAAVIVAINTDNEADPEGSGLHYRDAFKAAFDLIDR